MAAKRFSIEGTFKAIDKVTRPVTKMQNRVQKMTRSFNRGISRANRNLNKFAGGLKRAAQVATAAAVIIGYAGADIIRTGAQFEQSVVNASAKFGDVAARGTKAFEALEAAARKVGRTTEFTASESAEALNFLAMAGFSAKASIAALPGVVDLATAAQTDLARATDIATDSLGAFGLSTKDPIQLGKNLAKINDLIAKTATTANTTIDQMFEAIVTGGPSAMQAGASLETFAAIVGTMADAGIKGEKAGTAIRNMFLRLSAPAAGASKLLKDMGVKTVDSAGNLRDMFDILQDINKATKGFGTAQKASTMDVIFGKRSIAAATIVMNKGADGLREYRKQLEGAEGASKKMADTMRSTVSAKLKMLNSAIESVKISIFNLEKGPLADLIDGWVTLIRANEGLIAQNVSEFIAKIGRGIEFIVKHREKIGKVLGVILGIVVALKVMAAIMTIVAVIGAIMGSTIGLIVIGVMALIAGIAVLIAKVPILRKAFMAFWNGLKEIGSNLKEMFSGIIELAKIAGRFVGDKFRSSNDDSADQSVGSTQMVTPQERVARTIEESRESSTAEIMLTAAQGTSAELVSGSLGSGLQLQPSGAF